MKIQNKNLSFIEVLGTLAKTLDVLDDLIQPMKKAKRPPEHTTSYRPPWSMTYSEFASHKIPSPMGDRSRHPGDVAQLHEEGSSLYDYRNDDYAVKDFLGHGYNPSHDVSHLVNHVKANAPIKVYRATDVEDVIHPGAYVTPSKQYAIDHGERNMGRKKYHIIEELVRPDELHAMNPNEFFYAPKDLKGWHKKTVENAIKAGKPVPAHVAGEHELALPAKTLNTKKR